MSQLLSPTTLLEQIYQEHYKQLGEQAFAIVLCGSAAENPPHAAGDIDYVAVVHMDNMATLLRLRAARERLEAAIGAPMSNTIVRFEAVTNLEQWLGVIDGKAAQALLEAQQHPERVHCSVSFAIPPVTPAAIQAYSRQNFWTLQAIVRKHVVRSPLTLNRSREDVTKLLKLCTIALKMRRQYVTSLPSKSILCQSILSATNSLIDETTTLKAESRPSLNRAAAVVDAVLAIQPADFHLTG